MTSHNKINPFANQLIFLRYLVGRTGIPWFGKASAQLVNLQKPWRRIRKEAGLDDVRLHDLRHSFASIAVASGMSLPLIGALLGHSQPQTTARYAHLLDGPLKSAVKTVGERLRVVAGSKNSA